MTKVHQFYGGDGAPWSLPSSPDEIVSAWRTHRERLRRWLGELDELSWSRPTRCSEWDVADMAQHLITGAQFLGFTLHKARDGEATRFLEGFDAQATAAVATAQLDGMSHAALVDELEKTDARVDAELRAFERDGWDAMAEAPPGHVLAHLAVNHFLFDSWVHERDLSFPTPDDLPSDAGEALLVATYVLALAGLARAVDEDAPDDDVLDVHLVDLDRHVSIELSAGRAHVTWHRSGPATGTKVASGVLVDVATGRLDPGAVDAGLTRHLTRLAAVMA